MRKAWICYAAMGILPLGLWLLPVTWRFYGQLFGIPVLWGLASYGIMPLGSKLVLLGNRKLLPFVWIPGLFALSMAVLGAGYFHGLVIFSYGLTRPQVVFPQLLPIFFVLTIVLTFGVEIPLRKKIFQEGFLDRGMPMVAAMIFCAILGMFRSVPFYGNPEMPWLDVRYLSFILLHLFIRELTLCRLYWVSRNLLACGTYHALLVLIEAFVMSDVLGPYLPAFHWVSSNTVFYVLLCGFGLIPYFILCIVKPHRS